MVEGCHSPCMYPLIDAAQGCQPIQPGDISSTLPQPPKRLTATQSWCTLPQGLNGQSMEPLPQWTFISGKPDTSKKCGGRVCFRCHLVTRLHLPSCGDVTISLENLYLSPLKIIEIIFFKYHSYWLCSEQIRSWHVSTSSVNSALSRTAQLIP